MTTRAGFGYSNANKKPMPVAAHTPRAIELVKLFPEHGNLTLARILHNEYPLTTTIEGCRTAIRIQRGSLGQKRRDSMSKTLEAPKPRSEPLHIPQPFNEWGDNPWKPYRIRARRLLVLSDVHVPYFDADAVKIAVQYGIDHGADAVLLNGDLMDFYSISRYQTDPKQRDFKGEIQKGIEMLAWLREVFKGCQIIYKLGNHDERWESFMFQRAPEIVGIPEFEIEHWMHLDKLNIRLVKDMRPVLINKLNIIHGHEYKFAISNPVNPARGLYLRAKVSAIMGHLHQTSEHTETNLNGKLTTCWSSGCLQSLRPRYSPINKWNHGFCFVDTTGEDDFTVRNLRIDKGRIL